MVEFDIYKDIAERTNGDIYIGVVGPVRSGKSTFISRFMEEMVIPNITGSKKTVAIDELPQSAGGKTIMTTEPKFVPAEAVNVGIDNAVAKVKLIDCVGYLVDGALGHEENEKPRFVKTPWSDQPMEFGEASEFGTRKVINEHSTIGVVITTDGSFTDIPASNYVTAEKKVVSELKALGKPFIIIFNTLNPGDKSAQKRAKEMQDEYGVTVICDNVQKMDKAHFTDALERLVLEFPLRSFDVQIPKWLQALPVNNKLIAGLIDKIRSKLQCLNSMKSFSEIENLFLECDNFEPAESVSLDMGSGKASLAIEAKSGLLYDVLSEECDEKISDELDLIKYVRGLSEAKKNYVKLKGALECAEASGYGVVSPIFEETELSEPEVVKKNGGYSVRMLAKAKSLHIIRADVQTEVNPVYGSKKQCEDFVEMIKADDCSCAWNTEVFGRPLSDVVSEEVSQNSGSVNDSIKFKLRKTVNRAVNEKKSNLFCILI